MQRRLLLLAALSVPALNGCGFALRQSPDFAFKTLYSSLSETSPLGIELRRTLQATGKVRVITDSKQIADAEVILESLGDQRERVIVSTNSAGQVREIVLRTRFRFRLRTPGGVVLIPDTELLLEREISFNETAVLANEAEERLLYRDMQGDIVQQLLRRLAAVRVG
jgi:LPS-assembly lipoprotein